MKERPINCKAHEVRVLLDGTKTQMRRVVKGLALDWLERDGFIPEFVALPDNHMCPYGQPGDRLWVRETFARIDGQTRPWIETDYRATYTHGDRLGDTLGIKKRWTPSIHMPRHASRITLGITGVRVERLQDISEADAIAEGVHSVRCNDLGTEVPYYRSLYEPRELYRMLWESINPADIPLLDDHGKKVGMQKNPAAWDANPWVWVIKFKRLP